MSSMSVESFTLVPFCLAAQRYRELIIQYNFKLVQTVIYPDGAYDFHFLAGNQNHLKVAGIGILGQIATDKF